MCVCIPSLFVFLWGCDCSRLPDVFVCLSVCLSVCVGECVCVCVSGRGVHHDSSSLISRSVPGLTLGQTDRIDLMSAHSSVVRDSMHTDVTIVLNHGNSLFTHIRPYTAPWGWGWGRGWGERLQQKMGEYLVSSDWSGMTLETDPVSVRRGESCEKE